MRFSTFQLNPNLPNWILRIKEASSAGKWLEVLSYYGKIQKTGTLLTDPTVFPPVLKAFSNSSFSHGKSVHSCLIKLGFDSFTSIGNSILDFYAKRGDVDSAHTAFECMGSRDSVSWNIMIRGHFDHGAYFEGLWWFAKGRIASFEPNVSTLVLLIHACRSLKSYIGAQMVHGYIIRGGFWAISSIQNSLLSMYSDVDIKGAQYLFDEMAHKDIISWSVMISGYVQSGDAQVGLEIFKRMLCTIDVGLDGTILVSVLNGCSTLGDLRMGRSCHSLVINSGLVSDLFVCNSLIDMYSKCRDAESAIRVFNEMSERNRISWNSILSGLVLSEKYSEALSLYFSMKDECVIADEVTLMNLLQICKSHMQPLGCQSVHCVIIRHGHHKNELLLNCLIDSYAKCDMIECAWKIFKGMNRRDAVTWSTMIAGFTNCGKPDEAIAIFQEMLIAQLDPNEITIINVLEACSVIAELRRSKGAHGIAIRRGMAAGVKVGTAIVDMYSKCGAIDASRKAFDQLPQKNVFSWSAMISGYGVNGLAREALAMLSEMHLHNLKPNAVTCLSVLSACSHGGLIKEGIQFFKTMFESYGIQPELEHYSCVVDMLSRAGKFDCAMEVIMEMPKELKASASLWGALLSACRSFQNSELGESAVSHVIQLEPFGSAGYMLASSMYASNGLWADAARMRRLVNERKLRIVAGYSLVHVGDRTCKFVAGDESHPQAGEIHTMVKKLHSCMKIETRNDFEITE